MNNSDCIVVLNDITFYDGDNSSRDFFFSLFLNLSGIGFINSYDIKL